MNIDRRIVTGIMTLSCFLLGVAQVAAQGGSTRGAEKLYLEYCSPCHGESGKGDGELAYLLFPKPRDFTAGLFKLRSTPSGEVPTHDDLYKILKDGMTGTAMPSFRFLKGPELSSLVNHVKRLGDFENKGAKSVEIPTPAPYSDRLLAMGKKVYSDLGCHQCHGELGRGDGPSSGDLKDNWGRPIPVRDFTQGNYLGGSRPEDLYLRFVTGMDGTPMPSYLGMIQEMGESEKERQDMLWGLVYYVKGLEVEEAMTEERSPPDDGILTAKKVKRSLKESTLVAPMASFWKDAAQYSVPISRLWQKDRSNVVWINVQAVYNRKNVAVKLEWEDATQDGASYRVEDFQDGAAVQFSLGGETGFHGMGSPTYPADIWFWRAEWQLRKDRSISPDIALAYPNRVSDADVESYPPLINDVSYLPGVDAGNMVSTERIESPVEDANAAGPQTMTSQLMNEQNVSGKGMWDGGMWHVVFVRKTTVKEKNDVIFKRKKSYPIAFAVWNGSEGDRDGQKMVSTWYTLELK